MLHGIFFVPPFFFIFVNLFTLFFIIQKRAYLVDLINQFYWVFDGRSPALRVFFFFFFFPPFWCFVHIPSHFSLLTIHFPSLSLFLSSRLLSTLPPLLLSSFSLFALLPSAFFSTSNLLYNFYNFLAVSTVRFSLALLIRRVNQIHEAKQKIIKFPG